MSIGAVLLFLRPISRGAVAQVSSLFHLVPGVSAVMTWLAFDERLTAFQIVGMAIAVAGVAVATRN